MSIKELQDKQARITAEARERLDLIGKETDEARAAELEAAHDKAMAEYDRIGRMIEREQKLAEIEARANAADPRRPRGDNAEQRGADEGLKADYRMAFAKHICGIELEPEERAILRRGQSEARAQTAGTNSAGGYTVPTTLLNQIEISLKATGPMYDGSVTSEIVTSSGNPLKMPTIDDTSLTAAAHTEAGSVTDDGGADATVGQKSLDAYSFDTEWVRWSWELDADSIFSMEALLGSLLGERMGRTANTQLTTGTGSSAPNGIVTASSLGKTAAGAAAITADEIIDLFHSVDPAYRGAPKAAFMCNDATLAAVRKLKDGNGNYLWAMGNYQVGIPETILGKRLYVNQAMDSLATAKKVMLFGDFGKYYVRKVGQPVTFVARERFAPDMGILGLIRFDGELSNTAAVKHLITA